MKVNSPIHNLDWGKNNTITLLWAAQEEMPMSEHTRERRGGVKRHTHRAINVTKVLNKFV